MFGKEFYHESIRRYVIVFGTMFNDIVVHRKDENGTIEKRIKVPIAYGPKKKFLTRIQQDPTLTKLAAISLPRLSFQIVGYNYDTTRKLSTLGQIRIPATDDNKSSAVYNPVPWNIDFELVAYVSNAEDGTQIIEQILPFFTPDWTNTIKLVDDLDLLVDVPMVINSLTTEDDYEQSYENRRTILHTFNFTMKGYLFGPIKDKKVIKLANTRMYIDGFSVNTAARTAAANSNTYYEYIKIRPGLDANGDPTANEALSVPIANIAANDDWTYIIKTVVNPDFEDDQT